MFNFFLVTKIDTVYKIVRNLVSYDRIEIDYAVDPPIWMYLCV